MSYMRLNRNFGIYNRCLEKFVGSAVLHRVAMSMASGINFYSQLVISLIRIGDITILNK